MARYFDEIGDIGADTTAAAVHRIAATAFPRYAADPATLALGEALTQTTSLEATIRRAVIDATDGLRRALHARQMAG